MHGEVLWAIQNGPGFWHRNQLPCLQPVSIHVAHFSDIQRSTSRKVLIFVSTWLLKFMAFLRTF